MTGPQVLTLYTLSCQPHGHEHHDALEEILGAHQNFIIFKIIS